jgi:hypothetical protein
MPQLLSGLTRALKARGADREHAPRLLDPRLERLQAHLDEATLRARVKQA